VSSDIRYLCFGLGSEEYGLPLLTVREVLAQPEITPVPHTPAYFVGIMNLRGRVISVMDLRVKLGIKPANANADSVVVICQVGEYVVGITVDAVNSVMAPAAGEVSDADAIASKGTRDYVLGVYRKKERLALLLNVGRVLGLDSGKAAA
jgi:purine-binding chemotaxis protein CheW